MQDIRFPSFAFDSPLASTIIELERARGGLVAPARLPPLFAELRELFQHLMSMLSARIEGNRTTVVDALEGAAHADRCPSRAPGTCRPDRSPSFPTWTSCWSSSIARWLRSSS